MTLPSPPQADPADTGTSTCEPVPVWQYLAESIDEFAVAKAIVDHFEAQPRDLCAPGVETIDLVGLIVRAKVTIKREQIAYAKAQAEAQAASQAAQLAKTSTGRPLAALTGVGQWWRAVRAALAANPALPMACIALGIALAQRG